MTAALVVPAFILALATIAVASHIVTPLLAPLLNLLLGDDGT